LLDALEKQGLVARHSVANDRRVRNISIEQKGRETLVEIDRFASTMRTQLFEGVSEADLDATLRVLRHVTAQLEPRPAAVA
jgi:MarR family transcriptional regulator for hemolysin